MRILICGSRHYEDYAHLRSVLSEWDISTIIEGGARGVDRMARRYGEEHGIHVQTFPALWNEHGKRAGPIRNAQMLREGCPEQVIAFRGPNSRGTQNMIDQANKAGVETVVVEI